MTKIAVVQQILSANDRAAAENRARLDGAGVLALNIMASPGAGKTSVILATADRLPSGLRVGVIEGDLASSIDAEKVAAHGLPVVQINTGGGCHLDAPMIGAALSRLPLDRLRVLFIENVGNLVCPADFDLGAHINVVVASVPEGHDKTYKYPGMFAAAHAVLLNKYDLVDVFEFDVAFFRRGLEMVNATVPFFPLSCRSRDGLDAWVQWLAERAAAGRPATAAREGRI